MKGRLFNSPSYWVISILAYCESFYGLDVEQTDNQINEMLKYLDCTTEYTSTRKQTKLHKCNHFP